MTKKTFNELYDDIVASEVYYFTTISPVYTDESPIVIYDNFINILIKYRKIFTNLVGCVELTDQQRVHFHLMYTLDDNQKHYYFINKSCRGFMTRSNVLVLRNKEPKDKFSYLIKDDNIKNFLPQPMFDLEHIELKYILKKEEISHQKQELKRPSDLDVQWSNCHISIDL